MVIMSDTDYEQVDTVDVEGENTMVTDTGYVGLTREESDNNLCSDGGTS